MEPALTLLAVSGYRSLQQLILPLGRLTLITGGNGTGKSNLYRALKLVVASARGDLVARLAEEGGMPALYWAGPERLSREMRRGEVPVQGGPRHQTARLRLGFAGDPLSYAIELGYSADVGSAFQLDPQIKNEWIWAGGAFHPRGVLAQRSEREQRRPNDHSAGLLGGGADPREHPEVFSLRELVLSWRFYDGFRTDAAAPARNPGIASCTMALANDGHDLAAAVQTIFEIGDADGLQDAVAAAFPGCQLQVDTSTPRFALLLKQPGLLRSMQAAELSDGTLNYLLLATALFSPRLPPLLVLNEPERSLHPELLEPLAKLIAAVAQRTQVWVIAHAPAMVRALQQVEGCLHHQLEKELGSTQLPNQSVIERAAWRWPS